MTNPMFNPQPNYSGVTIQIANPAVNVSPQCQTAPCTAGVTNNGYSVCPQIYQNSSLVKDKKDGQYMSEVINDVNSKTDSSKANFAEGYTYPAEYYMNKYAAENPNVLNTKQQDQNGGKTSELVQAENHNKNTESSEADNQNRLNPNANISSYKDYAESYEPKGSDNLDASQNIIENLDERNAEIKEAKKNTKETKVVALTDDYIRSLENYLNNPNDEIRLMASKEILTRLDEDKNRYNDAALNALLNKMLQDPSKLIRLAALSAFASQLACGNDFTVQLLQNIQSNPNADKEDALQAADILLKMSAGVEVRDIPAGEEKREEYKMKVNKKVNG